MRHPIVFLRTKRKFQFHQTFHHGLIERSMKRLVVKLSSSWSYQSELVTSCCGCWNWMIERCKIHIFSKFSKTFVCLDKIWIFFLSLSLSLIFILLYTTLLILILYIYWIYLFFFFFFKQKTAYEIGVRLVGSEMCIRDRSRPRYMLTCLRSILPVMVNIEI